MQRPEVPELPRRPERTVFSNAGVQPPTLHSSNTQSQTVFTVQLRQSLVHTG